MELILSLGVIDRKSNVLCYTNTSNQLKRNVRIYCRRTQYRYILRKFMETAIMKILLLCVGIFCLCVHEINGQYSSRYRKKVNRKYVKVRRYLAKVDREVSSLWIDLSLLFSSLFLHKNVNRSKCICIQANYILYSLIFIFHKDYYQDNETDKLI